MTIAKKHAQQYMPNGELSLEQVIQAAIDEAGQPPDPVKLAELGWQMIECPICGGGAQAFPKPDKAAQPATVPVHDGNYADGALYKILDALYARGWEDLHKERYYDPRGTVEWQAVLDIFARAAVPVVGEVDKMAESISGMVMEWVTAASAHNGDWQSGLARIIRKRIERFQPTTSITAAELDALRKIESALPAIKAMLLQEREWKLENSECGGDEVMESLDRLSQAFDAAIAGEKK